MATRPCRLCLAVRCANRPGGSAAADRARLLDLPPDVPDPRESEEIERRAMLFQLVERLPEAQRQVIEMRFVDQKSIREIATALDRSEGAVKQLQLRALENLRKHMEGRDG